MSNTWHGGLGNEYPGSDTIQGIMLCMYLAIWVGDSFILEYTVFRELLPPMVRLLGATTVIITGSYLISRSHSLVLGEEGENQLVEWDVYSIVRHPMYLGILLIYLGLAISTLSVASLALWALILIVYDRFAEYEERELIRILGQRYIAYQERVHRWLPVKR